MWRAPAQERENIGPQGEEVRWRHIQWGERKMGSPRVQQQQRGDGIMKRPVPDQFPSEEAARRRDEVIRRMANTPPQPKLSPHPKKKKKAGAGRAARKGHADREA